MILEDFDSIEFILLQVSLYSKWKILYFDFFCFDFHEKINLKSR